ncbi:MAG: RluA family pseudouridine synthase [Proteobacteria bacterium]|nr:RluA family pseudouridine synthase [Pseudomonadota bacterium]
MIQPIKISPTEDGVRLNRWFLRHYPGISTGEFHKLCRTGQLRVNAGRCRGNEILHEGDMVRIPPSAAHSKAGEAHARGGAAGESGNRFSLSDLESLRKCIIRDDPDIVAFNKPAGLATQGGTGIKKSLDKMAAALFPYDTIFLVHRLDRETSGIIVCAKNQKAAQALAQEFQGKTASKEYLALLSGVPSAKSGIIDNFLAKGRVLSEEEVKDAESDAGARPRRAITKYNVLGELPGLLSWVQFIPLTGRTHQLRLHASVSLGCPIVGDELYGRAESQRDEMRDSGLRSLIGGRHLFLFARRLSFRHPGTGKIVTLVAEMPDFMQSVVRFLELEIPK